MPADSCVQTTGAGAGAGIMIYDWDETGRHWNAPGSQGERLRFHDFPAFHLMGLAGLAKQTLAHRYLEPWGLSMPEWRVLSTVAGFTPIRFARLARFTAMDKAQVSRALRSAQVKGLVESGMLPAEQRAQDRESASPVGRIQISVTPAGSELYQRIMPQAQRDQMRLIELMTVEERRLWIRMTQRLFDHLHDELSREPAVRSFRTSNVDAGAEEAKLAPV